MRILRTAAAVEATSLAILLLNLFTVHTKAITSTGGPVHGTAYLATIFCVRLIPELARPGVKWRSFVPGIGGMLVLRLLSRSETVDEGVR